MSLPAAVLFDMDGTLLDTEHLWLQAEMITMAEIGGVWTPEDQMHCLGGPLERVVSYMIGKADRPATPAEVQETLLAAIVHLLRSSPVAWRPGAREMLDDAVALGRRAAHTFDAQLEALRAALHARGERTGRPSVAGLVGAA